MKVLGELCLLTLTLSHLWDHVVIILLYALVSYCGCMCLIKVEIFLPQQGFLCFLCLFLLETSILSVDSRYLAL